MKTLPPITDDELNADLDRIAAEVKRRKKAKPPELSAAWAYQEQMTAFHRFNKRHPCGEECKWPELTEVDLPT